MKDEERDLIERELSRVTPGPWVLRYLSRHPVRSLSVMQATARGDLDLVIADIWLPIAWRGSGGEREERGRAAEKQGDANAAFLAHAPEHVQNLLDENSSLRQQVEQSEAVHQSIRGAVQGDRSWDAVVEALRFYDDHYNTSTDHE